MPVEHEVDGDNCIVRTTFSGCVSYDEVANHARKLRDDPAFKSHYSELVTFQEGSNIRLGFLDFRALLNLDPFLAGAKRAFVVPSRGSIFGVTRIYQTVRNDADNVKIFERLEDAVSWLAVSPIF